MQTPRKIILWFTLVELIVVITIVWILSTVGFVSYSGYLTWARDSNRFSQLTKLSDSLQVYSATKSLPLPDDYIEITANGTVIWYQWYAWTDVLEMIDYTNGWKDPKDDTYFTYYATKNRKGIQLMALMEDQSSITSIWDNNTVHAVDYSNRFPKVYWKSLWIFISSPENIPAQEIESNLDSWLDVINTLETYTSVVSNDKILTWTGLVLQESLPNGSCRRIRQSWNFNNDGLYQIYDRWLLIDVYCHWDYIDTNFYTFIDNPSFENLPNWWEWYENYISSWAARTGANGVSIDQYVSTIISNQYIYVDPKKTYELSWYFRSQWSDLSKLHFWFAEFDEDFNTILNQSVNVVPSTETKLVVWVNPSSTSIEFEDTGGIMCDTWLNHPSFSNLARIAFDIDPSGWYKDLPNFNTTSLETLFDSNWNVIWYRWFQSIVDNGDTCTLNLYNPINYNTKEFTYPAWTPIRMHLSWWSYNYIASGWTSIPNIWTLKSGVVTGQQQYWADQNYFRPGTRFIKILLIPNYRQTNYATNNFDVDLQMDDLSLEIQ